MFKWICCDNIKQFDRFVLMLIIFGSIKLGLDSFVD